MKISEKNSISKYRLFFNFLKEYPIFKTLIIITPLFFTLIVIGEINIILTYVEILKGVGSQEGISEADRVIFSRQALYYFFYNTLSYLALQLISSAFIYYNMKLYRTVIIYYLIKTMNINKHTYNRMSSGQIKDIIHRRAGNIYKMIESVFEKGMYHGIFVLYSLYIVYSKFGFVMFLYTIFTLVLFVAVTSFLIKRRNMVKIRYNAAHAKVSADRYNILTNFDIIKSYNREVEDVNTMDKNLLQMTNYGNRSNFLSAISGYSSRIVMVLPSGILYYIIMKYDIISTVSTGEEFVAYNGIFCMLKAKLNSLRVDLVRIGQYSVDLDSSDYDKMPRDIDNALLYYNYTDNKVNNRDPFTNVEFLEHETDQRVIYNDVGVRIGFNINKNVPLTSSRCISEKTVVVDDFDKNESMETSLDSEKAFVFNDKIIFRDLLVKANRKDLFRDANFTINRGEKIALVGKNGTGKSTFLDIILRFKDYEGVILVDGRNMNNIYKFDQRSKISYVPQKPGIISGSVLDNLRYHDDSIPQNIIEETCSKYGYHELFSNLPNGYDTDVGENGKFLSGGQQQKISFMRGLIKDGDIFIMDEPTANLDPQSEIQVVSQIFKLMSSKTVITIIHKHSLLSGFDKILGIYNGKIHIYTDYDEFMKDSHLF